MEQLEFDEIVGLLNKTRTVRIQAEPTRKESGWSHYTAEYVLPHKRLPFEILYLNTRITRDGAIAARKQAFKPKLTQVVYATSLDARIRFHKELFAVEADSFLTLRDYLASYLKDELHQYVLKLSQLRTKFYVAPQVITPIGSPRKIPNPLEQLLVDQTASEADQGVVGILLAEPGQGKTFMCDHIVSQLARSASVDANAVTPIYVASDQWRVMPAENLSSIWKTLGHSFRHYDAPIGWLENSEDEFLKVTLKAGLFRLVFDGFDEYILRNRGEIAAIDVLQQLGSLAASTGTKMLVTARTTFWDSEVKAHLKERLNADWSRSIREYVLQPFDRNHATKYFTLRFPSDEGTVSRATQLFDTLAEDTQESFAGRGFVLRLIADLYERDSTFSSTDISQGPTWWLMTKLCERERLRQTLPLSAEQQLVALQEFVKDVAKGQEPSTGTLEAAILVASPALTDPARVDCMQRMVSHPIINLDTSTDSWYITQNQAELALLAQFIRSSASEGGMKDLDSFSEQVQLDPGKVSDLATMLSEEVGNRSESEVEAAVLVKALRNRSSKGQALCPRLGFQFAVRFAMANADTKSGRSECLSKLLLPEHARGLVCSGSIAKFDFRGWVFEKCVFDNVRWSDCLFGPNTIFESCEFRGGTVDYCDGLGKAVWRNESGDADGLALVRSVQVESGARGYSQQDLRDDLGAVLRKFIPRAGYVFKTVKRDNLRTGVIRRSRFRDEIIEEVERQLLEQHEISGVTGGGYAVREDCVDAMRFFAQNNVFTGPIEMCFERLKRRAKI